MRTEVILNSHLPTPHYHHPAVDVPQLSRKIVDFVVGTHLIRTLTKDFQNPDVNKTEWTLEVTIENIQDKDPSFTITIAICEAVKATWWPSSNEMIVNLPSTVESTMPSTFADPIKLFC